LFILAAKNDMLYLMTSAQLLAIDSWAAWTPELPRLDNLNLKRRCSHASKMAISTATQAMNNQSIDYAIFCSQHGELNCTASLLKDIYNKEILSPLHFSQSVHNTAAGLFSVLHHLREDMTTIAAGINSFFMGILEASSWLHLNPGKLVLLTMFDEAIPPIYQELNIQNNHAYSVSLLLSDQTKNISAISLKISVGAGFSPRLQNALLPTRAKARAYKGLKNHSQPPALEFLEWVLQSDVKELSQNTSQYTINWQKK
jgi:hypothetical protein